MPFSVLNFRKKTLLLFPLLYPFICGQPEAWIMLPQTLRCAVTSPETLCKMNPFPRRYWPAGANGWTVTKRYTEDSEKGHT